MKYINKISLLFLLTIFLSVGFSSCTVDEPVIITSKTVDQYITQFSQYVASERTNLDKCVVGYNKGDFTPVSATSFNTYTKNYRVALQADSAVIVKPEVTIAELVNANTSLAVPGKAFWGKINISDRRSLNDSITAATTLNTGVLVGSLSGNVSQSAKTAFSTAITTAITTRDALTTIDRQVTEGNTALSTAKKTFISAIIK
jgi:hypothetical protein